MRPRGCTALLLDPPDWHGRVAADDIDDAVLTRLREVLRDIWPRHTVFVQQWSPAGVGAPRSTMGAVDAHHVSDKFTDVRRLADLPLEPCSRVVVLRPGALLLPAEALQDLLQQAQRRDLDLAVLAGLPAEVCYVVSERTLSLLASISDVPGTATVPQVVERLSGVAGGRGPLGLTRVAPSDASWLARAGTVAPATWRAVPSADLLALPSGERLAALITREQAAFADAHTAIFRHRPGLRGVATAATPARVLVVLPSMFQTGAHAAWAELASALSPAQVSFVVGRATMLARVLRERGFAVHEVAEGLASGSAADAAVLLDAFDAIRPDIVHLDGAEGNAWAGLLHARGARIVVHVRLNDAERFRPSFLYADAIVGVSEPLCGEIALRVGTAVPVVTIPDGVRLASKEDASPAALRPDLGAAGTEVSCLCIGRIEPAKDQRRVLDIFDALRAHIACRLILIGPCGSDAAYCDEVRRRVGATDGVEWRPFTFPLTDAYQQAHVVLVGSKNEALGMVGLETLAAGGLLVAQRSTGYECIIDPAQREGVLFERDDAPEAVARRIIAALDDFETYSTNARRKAAECFDVLTCAARLSRLWHELSAGL